MISLTSAHICVILNLEACADCCWSTVTFVTNWGLSYGVDTLFNFSSMWASDWISRFIQQKQMVTCHVGVLLCAALFSPHHGKWQTFDHSKDCEQSHRNSYRFHRLIKQCHYTASTRDSAAWACSDVHPKSSVVARSPLRPSSMAFWSRHCNLDYDGYSLDYSRIHVHELVLDLVLRQSFYHFEARKYVTDNVGRH